jgi:hypothetical protein
MTHKEKIIRDYVDAYNNFDIDKMVVDFDENIVFENVSNGEINMSLTGLTSFKEQAQQAKSYFSKRTQTIKSFKHENEQTEIAIDYYAILAIDFPNGLQKGDELKLQGKSIFKFVNGKINKLTDIS